LLNMELSSVPTFDLMQRHRVIAGPFK